MKDASSLNGNATALALSRAARWGQQADRRDLIGAGAAAAGGQPTVAHAWAARQVRTRQRPTLTGHGSASRPIRQEMTDPAAQVGTSSTTSSRGAANRWAVLALLGVAQLMIVLDVTIVNIALPSAQQALHFSTDERQWIITAYALTFGSLLLSGGKLGDMFGRKWTFVAGLLGFAGASALGGLAPSFGVLVAARVLQGSFGALLAPSALSLLTIAFHNSPDRPKAFGVFSAIAASGTSVGLLLGGVLTQTLSWRWCLYVNLIFAIPTAIAASRLVDAGVAPRPRPQLDLAGVATVSAGFFCLVYGFSNAESHTWSAGLTIAAFTASAVLLASFVLVEHRVKHPLLPLRIVADRSRGGAYASMAVVGAALFSVFLFMTYYMQQILHFSPIKTGLGFLPLTGTIIIVAPLAQTKILPRLGPRAVITAGMTLGVIAMVIFTQLTPGGSYAGQVLPGLIPAGAGAACVFSASFATGTLGVQHADAGVAAAVVNTAQQIGGSIGTALLSTIFAGTLAGYLASHPPAHRSLADASVHAYAAGFTAGAVIFAAGLLLALVLLPPRRAIRARTAAPATNTPGHRADRETTRLDDQPVPGSGEGGPSSLVPLAESPKPSTNAVSRPG
jgi:EmrB/QacA subfamily drug resistance transporter